MDANTAYTVIKATHNVIRWIVVIVAVIALVRAYRGWLGKRDWTRLDRIVGTVFASMMDTQLLLGGIMVIMAGGFLPFPRITMEHIIPMVIAVFVVHFGNVFARRHPDDVMKHRRAALWFTAAVLVILVAIPWVGRPLFPGM